MEFAKKFFSFNAEMVTGTKEEIERKINNINEDPNKSIAFTSNLVLLPDGTYAVLMQVKIPKRRS